MPQYFDQPSGVFVGREMERTFIESDQGDVDDSINEQVSEVYDGVGLIDRNEAEEGTKLLGIDVILGGGDEVF